MAPRFQRMGVNPDMLRMRMSHQSHQSYGNQQPMYSSPQRVAFPNQSPTGGMVTNLRSPSPMTSMGGIGSPPGNQVCFSCTVF